MYKRAIVPLDGSPFAEAVLPFFRQIAGPLDMEVLLLRVVPPPAMAPIEGPPRVVVRERETRRVDAEAYLARLAEDLRHRGVRVDTRETEPRPVGHDSGADERRRRSAGVSRPPGPGPIERRPSCSYAP